MASSKKRGADAAQSAAFIEKARELGADGDDSNADLLMNRLAKMRPEPCQTKRAKAIKRRTID
jgi:hypothetical protein